MGRMFKRKEIGFVYYDREKIKEGDTVLIIERDFMGSNLERRIKGKVEYFPSRACFGVKTTEEYGIHLSFDEIPFKYYKIDKIK